MLLRGRIKQVLEQLLIEIFLLLVLLILVVVLLLILMMVMLVMLTLGITTLAGLAPWAAAAGRRLRWPERRLLMRMMRRKPWVQSREPLPSVGEACGF